jgi:metal-responsive CopG/Arc/MetJ family transcriptional regulator
MVKGMKVETFVTLSEEVIRAIDERAVAYQDRSAFIEAVLWAFIRRSTREEQDQRDLAILNQHADRLNQEAADVLEYQVVW